MVRRRLDAWDLLLLRLMDANDSCECDVVRDGTGSAAEPASVKTVDAADDWTLLEEGLRDSPFDDFADLEVLDLKSDGRLDSTFGVVKEVTISGCVAKTSMT